MNRKALIVDDRENWRIVLETLLRKKGFAIFSASCFVDANTLIEQEIFDLAIFDARLIDNEEFNLDGLRLLSIIKEKTPSIKTILISDYPNSFSENPEQLEINPPEGADKFMYKVPKGSSFDKHKFNEIISELFNEKF